MGRVGWGPGTLDCADDKTVMGCTTSRTGSDCLELTTLAHEIDHVVIGDCGHKDPRWTSDAFWAEMSQALRAGVPVTDDEVDTDRLTGSGTPEDSSVLGLRNGQFYY